MTKYGRLYGYEEEVNKWNWKAVDDALFDGHTTIGNVTVVLAMIEEQFNLPLQNVWRVHVLNNGMVELNDFTMPTSTGKMRDVFKQEDLPLWVQDSLSVLMIVDQGVTVEGVGKKINTDIFYILETPEIKELYGNEARSQSQEADSRPA